MPSFDLKEEKSVSSLDIVLDFNTFPVPSAHTKHNTAQGSLQCRPGKQLWLKTGRGSEVLPLDKPSLNGIF